jgi:hypothetical protein
MGHPLLKGVYLELALNITSERGCLDQNLLMIGVIWNCRGVAKKGREISIRDLITEHNADFIGLQET